jgi:hypothetical protein
MKLMQSERKLINDVAHVLKALFAVSGKKSIKVDYRLWDNTAYIFWPPDITSTGNGHERYYSWETIDALKEVSDEKGITYKIGLTDSLEMNIKITVS